MKVLQEHFLGCEGIFLKKHFGERKRDFCSVETKKKKKCFTLLLGS